MLINAGLSGPCVVEDEPWLTDLIEERLCGTVELGRSGPVVLIARDQGQAEQ